MTTYFAVNLATLVPLGALGKWLDVSVRRFVPARADDDAVPVVADQLVRRLSEELAAAARDAEAGAQTYTRVVEVLRPAIRRRLDPRSTAGPEVRARLLAITRAGPYAVRTPDQLRQLLHDLQDA